MSPPEPSWVYLLGGLSCPEHPVAVGTVEQSVDPGLTVPVPVAEPLAVPLVEVPLDVPVVDVDTPPV